MNLIKELGGYEKAKVMLQAVGHEHDAMLLEYRRQHNIFEAGDYVIDEQYTGLLKVSRVMKKRLDVVYLNPQVMNHICGSSILIRHVRHATDAEIKAGYKL